MNDNKKPRVNSEGQRELDKADELGLFNNIVG